MTEVLGLFAFIGFIALTVVITTEGSDRRVGWLLPLVLCFIATPISGLIAVALSKRKDEEAHEKFMRDTLAKINNRIAEMHTKENTTA